MLQFKNILLAAVVLVFGYALIPPREETEAKQAEKTAASNARFTIRIAPGLYMPGRRPMDVGEKLHGLSDVAHEFEKLYPDTHIEFSEMPGLRLTAAQASRLLALDPAACDRVLHALVDRGVLRMTGSGHYMRRPPPH